MILGALWFKQEKDCDSEFFCSNSLSLHLGRIKMSRSNLKFKGRVIWTEKCGLTFHLSVIIISYTNSRLTEAVRSRCQFIKKSETKETSFRRQKIDQERRWKATSTSQKVFCEVFSWKQAPFSHFHTFFSSIYSYHTQPALSLNFPD